MVIFITVIYILLLHLKKLIGKQRKMQRALVFFNIESGSEKSVLEKVKKVKGVEEAYVSYGAYDLAVKVRADSMKDLNYIISKKLRQNSKVRSTISLLLIEN